MNELYKKEEDMLTFKLILGLNNNWEEYKEKQSKQQDIWQGM
jgi:hypothetical protein